MMIDQITQQAGARKRRKRVGRGQSSGLGKTSGRGNKGMQSRAGGGARPLYEGGQMPIFRRVAKRGFSNFRFRTEYDVVNVGALEKRFTGGENVDLDALKKSGLVRRGAEIVKLLGEGALTRKLNITVNAATPSAREAVEKAGGKLTVIEARVPAALWKAKRNTVKKARAARIPAKS